MQSFKKCSDAAVQNVQMQQFKNVQVQPFKNVQMQLFKKCSLQKISAQKLQFRDFFYSL